MKKLIVLLMLAAAPLQAQWWAGNAHPENYHRMAPVDSLPAYREYAQPKIYETWWKEIAACEHVALPASYKDVRFFKVNGAAFAPAEAPVWLDGLTYPVVSQIYVAAPFVDDEELVKHEMLHWAVWNDGYRLPPILGEHPIEMFEICGIHRTGP